MKFHQKLDAGLEARAREVLTNLRPLDESVRSMYKHRRQRPLYESNGIMDRALGLVAPDDPYRELEYNDLDRGIIKTEYGEIVDALDKFDPRRNGRMTSLLLELGDLAYQRQRVIEFHFLNPYFETALFQFAETFNELDKMLRSKKIPVQTAIAPSLARIKYDLRAPKNDDEIKEKNVPLEHACVRLFLETQPVLLHSAWTIFVRQEKELRAAHRRGLAAKLQDLKSA